MTEQRIRVRDGAQIAIALQQTEADKPRIALIHSLGMDRHFWKPVADLLAQQAHVLTIDCRGHGQSDKTAGPYSTSQFANDLQDVFAAIHWPSAVVAGASMGGCVALQFAADHPDQTDGLGLVDTTCWYGPTAPQDWTTRANKALSEGLSVLVEFQLSRWFSDDFRAQHPDVVKTCVDTFLRNEPNAFAATCHMLGAFDDRPALGGIQAPTAIVVGEQDYATPLAMAQALKDGIAHASFQVIPHAKHLTPLETSGVVANVLGQLLTLKRA